MEIHPGAGGTEAMDWGQMLLRMYQRYCDTAGLNLKSTIMSLVKKLG